MSTQPLTILYEDNHLLAIEKPAGVLSQGDKTGDESLLEMGKAYLKEKYNKPGDVFLGLVHRLDRPTSGVILFARTSKAASRLSEQFRQRTTEKIYRAVVEGRPPAESGQLIHYLTGGEHRGRVHAYAQSRDGAKRAALEYEVLRSNNRRTELKVKLLTGLKHQIRVQLSSIGCPIVGDKKYDNRKHADFEPVFGGRGVALHAEILTIKHPTREETVTIRSDLPAYWRFF